MASNDLRFVQISVAMSSQTVTAGFATETMRIFGLTKEGVVYEWSNNHQAWGAMPMKEVAA